MRFDYFYSAQADMFTFYRIPKNLVTDERFANLSSDAKLLYGLMLDRMGLSAKNGWCDEHGRVYIVYSIEEVMEAMRVKSNTTACKYMAELDTKKGVGLIERVRLGQGLKDRIYVLNFTTCSEATEQKQQSFPAAEINKPAEKKKDRVPLSPQVNHSSTSSINYTSRSLNSKLLEKAPQSGEFQKFKNCTSGNLTSKYPEMQKLNAINNTKSNNNKLNNTMLSSSHITHSINTDISMPTGERTSVLTAQDYENIRRDIEEQIEADTLKEEHGNVIDEIVELITDVMISPAHTLRTAGADRPTDILRAQFQRLKAAHVESALWRLNNRASEEITDMKAYMRTLLYNELYSNETSTQHAYNRA